MAGEPSQRHRCERMHNGIVPVHTGHVIADCAKNGNRKINIEEGLSRVRDSWRKAPLLQRPRAFRPEDLGTTDAQQRKNCHGHHQNTDTTQPRQEAPPKVHAHRQLIKPSKNRCTGSCNPGNGFKESMSKRQIRDSEIDGQRSIKG